MKPGTCDHGCVRVVAGQARGRRLVAPKGHDVRPTSDRVREAIGNRLLSLGAVQDAHVLDLFAGTGALGIEALSRGAARATFVEHDRHALECIVTNLTTTGLEARATVVRSDALRYVDGASAAAANTFDVAFVDPPYAFDEWDELLLPLPAELAVCEAGRPITPPAGWEVGRSDRYGTTVVTLLHKTPRHT